MPHDGSNSDKKRTRNGTIAAALIGAVAVIGAALIGVFFSHGGGGGTPSPPTLPSSSQVSGTITDPSAGASQVPSPKTLTASGTVRHLEPGHHLLLFFQFGVQKVYWAGDPDVVIRDNHWTGTVCIGDPGDITLLLVDMGPQGLAVLKNTAHNYWGSGVPFLPTKLAPDVSILNQIYVTAVRTKTACVKHEPEYY